jgi:hypothetical protein
MQLDHRQQQQMQSILLQPRVVLAHRRQLQRSLRHWTASAAAGLNGPLNLEWYHHSISMPPQATRRHLCLVSVQYQLCRVDLIPQQAWCPQHPQQS